MKHHDEYDSKTSQSKGVTAAELVEYKQQLRAAIASNAHTKSDTTQSVDQKRKEAIYSHDKRIFHESDAIMPENFLRAFLDELQGTDSFITSNMQKIYLFRTYFANTGNQYINEDISQSISALLAAVDSLVEFIVRSFFVYPLRQEGQEYHRLCLYPELNIDRGGSGDLEEMVQYDKSQEHLDSFAEATQSAYVEYRIAVKSRLTI